MKARHLLPLAGVIALVAWALLRGGPAEDALAAGTADGARAPAVEEVEPAVERFALTGRVLLPPGAAHDETLAVVAPRLRLRD